MKKQQIPNKLTLAFYTFMTLLVIAAGIAILIALNILGIGWAWEIVAVVLGVLIFIIVMRTPLKHRLAPILRIFFPIIDYLIERNRKRAECREIVNNMEVVLQHFRLLERVKDECRKPYSEAGELKFECKERLINQILDSPTRDDSVLACCDAVNECLKRNVESSVLAILYFEIHNKFDLTQLSPRRIYGDIKKDPGMLDDLARVIFESRKIPDSSAFEIIPEAMKTDDTADNKVLPVEPAKFPNQKEDLIQFLRDMDNFTMDGLNERVNRFRGIWKLTNSYLVFLEKNEIASPDYLVKTPDILKTIKTTFPQAGEPNQLLEVMQKKQELIPIILNQYGAKSIGAVIAKHKTRKVEWLEGVSLLSQIIFLNINHRELSELQMNACKLAALNDTAVRLNLAYLLIRMRPPKSPSDPGPNFITIRDIVENGPSELAKRQKQSEEGYFKEIAAIQMNLEQGNWLNRIHLLREFIHQNMISETEDKISQLNKTIKKYPGADTVLKRLFQNLSRETIERFLEARNVTAYLLTFDSERGSMADLIGCFVKEDCADLLKRAGVKNKFNKRPKYYFKDYTKNARIGIVPKGMTFDEFYQSFESDLKKLYRTRRRELSLSQNELDDFEVIIHRFGVSGSDRHGFEGFDPGHQDKHALPKFRILLAETLDLEDSLAVMGYEQRSVKGSDNLRFILQKMKKEGTIAEFVAPNLVDLSKHSQQILSRDDKAIKEALCKLMGFRTIEKLGAAILNDKTRKEVQLKLEIILMANPAFKKKPALCQKIAEVYINNLHDLSAIL